MGRFIDETGNTYGRWTVIRRVENGSATKARFLCRCECGNEAEVSGNALRKGRSTQCKACGMEPEKRANSYLFWKFRTRGWK
jgi:hypothetical protein